MTATIAPFPWKHGNPMDPTVQTIKEAFHQRGEPMTDDEARTWTRGFMQALDRIRSAQATMSPQQAEGYIMGLIVDEIRAAEPRGR